MQISEMDMMMRQLIADMPRIITYCKEQGFSPYNAVALVEWHRLRMAEEYGVQTKGPKQMLETLVHEEGFRREIASAGEQSGSALCDALLFMADHPDYATHIERLYEDLVRPMLRNGKV